MPNDIAGFAEELKALDAKATKGPWETDSYMTNSQQEASIQIRGPKGNLLFDSSNADTVSIDYEADEHGTHYFDEGSTPNYNLVCKLRNSLPLLLALCAEVEFRQSIGPQEKEHRWWIPSPTTQDLVTLKRLRAATDAALAALSSGKE